MKNEILKCPDCGEMSLRQVDSWKVGRKYNSSLNTNLYLDGVTVWCEYECDDCGCYRDRSFTVL